MFTSTIFSVLALASTAFAVGPLRARQQNLPVPDVTYPHSTKTAVWVSGVRHNVTWNPTGLTGTGATIYLAKGGIQDPVSALASGFDMSVGRIEVTVPTVQPASDYTVHFALNGNFKSSAPFVITTNANSIPPSVPAVTTGVTTIAFPSTTVVASLTGGSATGSATTQVGSVTSSLASVTSAAGSSASSVASSLSGQASSLASSLSAAQSSVTGSLSSALSSATAPLNSLASSASAAATSAAGNSASHLAVDTTVLKAMSAVAAIALSAAAFVL